MKKIFLILPLLGVVILVIYEGLILYDNHFRYGRMWETPALKPLERPLLTMPEGAVPITGEEELLRLAPPEDIKSPLNKDDLQVIKRGKTLYATYCAQCHGKQFDGKGTVGQSFYPPLPDLKSAKVQSLPEGLLFKEISFGSPGKRQPPLAATIDILDRWRIIAYIQSLGVRE
jgi:mono/diheme cytochrome c family protein